MYKTPENWSTSLDGVPDSSGVYLLRQGDGVYYVGSSSTLATRLRSHPQWEPDAQAAWLQLPDSERLYAECYFIAQHRPARNIARPTPLGADEEATLVTRLFAEVLNLRQEVNRMAEVLRPESLEKPATPASIGSTIRRLRRAQELVQVELAGAAGVSTRLVVEVESGKSTAQIGKVLHLLEMLGHTVQVVPKK